MKPRMSTSYHYLTLFKIRQILNFCSWKSTNLKIKIYVQSKEFRINSKLSQIIAHLISRLSSVYNISTNSPRHPRGEAVIYSDAYLLLSDRKIHIYFSYSQNMYFVL